MPFVRKGDSKQTLQPADVRKIFVGRTDEIHFFNEHILKPEEPTYNIISISGNGGVGKSTLIRRFIDEVQSSRFKDSCLVGLVDERQSTPASIMERFADQLSEGRYPLTDFEKALIQHKETLHRLWAQREAAQDTGLHEAVDLVGTVAEDLLPGGKLLHKGANVVADLYVKERQNRQLRKDAQWLEDPIGELTQQFVDELNSLTDIMTSGPNRVKRRLRVILFFDTFEQLAIEAAPWLLDHFLQARISTHVVLVIAGRDSLEHSTPDDPKRWLQYRDDGVIHLIDLAPFTEEETRIYLTERAITDQEYIESVWHLSGGLPLYLSLLTFNPRRTVDPTADVVANFLRWLPEEEQVKRRLVLMAALFSRPFNQDDLAAFAFIPEQEQAAHYRWLIRLPFMKSNQLDGRYSYHELVRDLFTLYLYQQSPKEYFETRCVLASYYRLLLENMQAVEDKLAAYSAVKLEIVLALMQQLFLLPDEASHFSATELILSTYERRKQAGEFAKALRELSQERANNLASVDTHQITKALSDYIEADQSSQDLQARLVLSNLLENIVHRPFCPPSLLARYYRERGIIHWNFDEYQQAVSDLDRAIELDPRVAQAHAYRGSAYRHLKEYQQAIADFDCAIELDPSYPRAYLSRGNAYGALEDHQRAIADYSRAIELDPKYVAAYLNRGNTYHRLKDYQQAIADFDHAIEFDSRSAKVYAYRGSAYRHLKEYQQAIADFDHTIELDPGYPRAYLSRGNAYYMLRDYERAIADYSRAIELNPKYVRAYAYRGDTYRELKDYRQAIADYDSILDLDPKDPTAFRRRGSAYRLLKDYQRAIADYNHALELDPKYVIAYISRALAYQHLKDYRQATADLNYALELDPKSSHAYVSRSLLYQDLKNYQQAIADLNSALQLDPDYADAYKHRGDTNRLLKNYQQAIADLNRALQLEPHDADIYLKRGETYLYLQDIDQARADLLRAQELDSRNITIGWMVEWVGMLQERPNTKLAEQLERVAEIDPTDYLAYVCKGILLWLNGSFKEATTELEQAIILEPDAYEMYYWKGMIFASQRQDEEAIVLIEKALEMQLPPVLLRHFAWSTLKRLDFYEKYVVSLLARNEVIG